MKTQISLKTHLVHLSALIILVGQIVFPDPARSQTWTQTGISAGDYEIVASSADGSKLVTGVSFGVNFVNGPGPVYISTNSGAAWTMTSLPSQFWSMVTSSADGTKLVALAYVTNSSSSLFYVSTNAGANWTNPNGPTNCFDIACSADGTKVVAVGEYTSPGNIYTSTNSGFTWTQTSAPSAGWVSVASSADGTKLVAEVVNGGIYRSTNSGATWTVTTAPTASYQGIACSADGRILVAASAGPSGGGLYTSTNAGVTWTEANVGLGVWESCASSADGTKLAVTKWFGGGIYISSNSGVTWTQPAGQPTLDWGWLALSADGNQLLATTGPQSSTVEGNANGSIYTLQTTPTPSLSLAPSATNAVLSWTIPSLNFVLRQNSDLTTTNWTNVATPPVLNLTNLQNQVIVPPPSSGNLFYRLKH